MLYFAPMNELVKKPVRQFLANVELFNSSTGASDTFYKNDRLKSFAITRTGNMGKFFGYGITQKLSLKLIDKDRELSYPVETKVVVKLGCADSGYDYYIPFFPNFYVTESNRDEITNELSITAYDALAKAQEISIAEAGLTAPYTLGDVATKCAELLGLEIALPLVDEVTDSAFSLSYPEGANLEGSETLREILDAIAEATQTIYFIDYNQKLCFYMLGRDGGSTASAITQADYIELDTKTNRRLSDITQTNELGDSVTASIGMSGTTQFVRNNPFWDMREDIGDLVEQAIERIGGLTIAQFSCSWRGNPLYLVGDNLLITTKEGETISTFLLNDTLEFDGSLRQTTNWIYEENDNETASNPTTLGEALKQTYAKVDKANKQINILASDISTNAENISQLAIDTGTISASVSSLDTAVRDGLEGVNEELAELRKQVDLQITDEDLSIKIQEELNNGVNKVTTTTGFTFDDTGLNISKTDSEMRTSITEDGMKVYKNDETMLVADNQGVRAQNLHATTYLIIGTNSRFEDYELNGESRTGCFWIGG